MTLYQHQRREYAFQRKSPAWIEYRATLKGGWWARKLLKQFIKLQWVYYLEVFIIILRLHEVESLPMPEVQPCKDPMSRRTGAPDYFAWAKLYHSKEQYHHFRFKLKLQRYGNKYHGSGTKTTTLINGIHVKSQVKANDPIDNWFLTKRPKICIREKRLSSTNHGRIKLDPYLSLCTKTNSK